MIAHTEEKIGLRTGPIERDFSFSLISENITTPVSHEPLVAVYPSEEQYTYDLFVHVYVPTGVTPTWFGQFDQVGIDTTPAGDIQVRYLYIQCDELFGDSYSLWASHIHYTIDINEAQAIRVLFDVGDPRSTRGTVTTVSNTRMPM